MALCIRLPRRRPRRHLEHGGKLCLIGKVKDKTSNTWASTCLSIQGMQRNLFVLPRPLRVVPQISIFIALRRSLLSLQTVHASTVYAGHFLLLTARAVSPSLTRGIILVVPFPSP